jgi:hypothetical protein
MDESPSQRRNDVAYPGWPGWNRRALDLGHRGAGENAPRRRATDDAEDIPENGENIDSVKNVKKNFILPKIYSISKEKKRG